MGWCIECHQLSNVDVAGSHIDGASESEDSYYGVIHQRLLKDKEQYQKYLEDDLSFSCGIRWLGMCEMSLLIKI
jgi:hypothetical protein